MGNTLDAKKKHPMHKWCIKYIDGTRSVHRESTRYITTIHTHSLSLCVCVRRATPGCMHNISRWRSDGNMLPSASEWGLLNDVHHDTRDRLLIIHEGYKGVNWQPSKGLNIYRQPRFREIFNRQMTNWQSSVKREIYSGKKKSWVRLRVTSLCGIKCQNPRGYPGARNILVLTAYFTDKAIILLILTKGPKF